MQKQYDTFEEKKKLVEEEKSEIFENWNHFFRISKEEFIENLKWLHEDPLDSHGFMTREIGIQATPDALRKADDIGFIEKYGPEIAKKGWREYNESKCEAHIIKLRRVNGPGYWDGDDFEIPAKIQDDGRSAWRFWELYYWNDDPEEMVRVWPGEVSISMRDKI